MREKVSPREKESKTYRSSWQGAFLDDKRDSAVRQRKMLQQVEDARLAHAGDCGCVGCMARKIGVGQRQSDPMGRVAQRTVMYGGTNYGQGNWKVLWGLLGWGTGEPVANRTWLVARAIKGREVRRLIGEASRSNAAYDLGANTADAYTWIQNRMKGLSGLTAATVHNLGGGGMLRALKTEAETVKGFFTGGQEFQSMNFEGHLFTTGNKNGFFAPGALGGRALKNYNEPPLLAGNTVINASGFPAGSHAEIILLAKVIRHVYETDFPGQLISIAGRRLPCSHCQQVINRFIMANQGWVQLDYVKAQDAGAIGITDAQKKNPDSYTNALSILDTPHLISENNINAISTGADIPERKAWLKRMLDQVIRFTPKVV